MFRPPRPTDTEELATRRQLGTILVAEFGAHLRMAVEQLATLVAIERAKIEARTKG